MKISVHQGLTLPIPGKDFSSLRYDVTLTDIDIDEDIDEQITKGLAAVEKVTEAGEKALGEGAASITGLNFEGFGVSDIVRKLNAKLENVIGEVKRQRDVLESRTLTTDGAEIIVTKNKKGKE
jgi:hypothetical protein